MKVSVVCLLKSWFNLTGYLPYENYLLALSDVSNISRDEKKMHVLYEGIFQTCFIEIDLSLRLTLSLYALYCSIVLSS